jgi:hypothetical protein
MFSHRWLSRRGRPNRALRALPVLLAAAAIASGCASPEEPTARRPIIPQTVQDLQARQQGDDVVLTFTLPSQSTRKEPLAAAPAIEIYRGAVEAGRPPEKTSTRLLYTIPGEMANSFLSNGRIIYRDAIAAGAAGTEQVYTIRTRAARNRSSAESNRVVVRVRPAPAIVTNVSARVAGQSVTVSWPRDANADYRVYKAEIAPESAAAAAADPAKALVWKPLVQVAQMGPATSSGSASLQYQDEDVEFRHSYMYFVRRVAQFGADTVESADSKAVVITVAEAVPPAAPQDVEAVVVPAAGTEAAYVSLSWAISPDAGIAGYWVYRSEQEGVRGARLNGEPAGSPTYRDASVAAVERYFYSVTAVDAAGQESAPSAAAEAQIPAAQP